MHTKTKSCSSRNSGACKNVGGLTALVCLAFLSFSIPPLRAQVPAGAVVELGFSDGVGSSTATNTGTLGGWANLLPTNPTNDPEDTAGNEDPSGYPLIATNHPAGPYAPANQYSLNNGNVTGASGDGNGTGGWETTTTNTPYLGGTGIDGQPPAPGALTGTPAVTGPEGPIWSSGFSLTLWLNAVDLSANGKQNEIVYALDAQSGGPQNGFNLVHDAGGQLQFSINESGADGPISVESLTADPNAGTANWVFIGITYDPNLAMMGSNSLCYYFGNANQLAYLDSTYPYVGGQAAGQGLPAYITNTGCLTLGNYGNVDANYEGLFGGNSSRIFKGYIAEVKVYSNVLSISQIQEAQANNVVPPTAPTFLAGGQPASVSVPQGLIATFTAVASGSGQLVYTWMTNGVAVPGVSGSSFTISSVTAAMNGMHISVGVTNGVSPGILSSNATLTVVPANPLLVSLSFDEGYLENPRYTTNLPNNSLTANAGALGGKGVVNVHTDGSGYGSFPYFSSYVPVGPYAPNPAANLSSYFVGNYYDNGGFGSCSSPTVTGQGERWIDFNTNALSATGAMPTMNGITICGWANSGNYCYRGSGNTFDIICDCLNSPATAGFRLCQNESYALELEVNQAHSTTDAQSSGSIAGPGILPVDGNFGSNNWTFFAVTYDGTLSVNNVNYYFGNTTTSAALDTTSPLSYPQGVIANNSSGPLTIGSVNTFGSGRTITGQNSPCFRGYLDEIKIYSSVLTLSQIQAVQTATEVPIILFANVEGSNIQVSWGATTAEQLQSKTNLATGSWINVTNTPVVANNIYTVTLPMTSHQMFFRLAP